MKIHTYYTYIMAGGYKRTLYVGVTNNLERRVVEHRQGMKSKFAHSYRCFLLVYYETFLNIHDAIAREKQLKSGSRQKKIELIERDNPQWHDLTSQWYE